MNREDAVSLLNEWIANENLRLHCIMVAHAMEWYAQKLDKCDEEKHKWWLAGLLHDLDWEKYPDEHPNFAIANIFPKYNVSNDVLQAIKAHAPERTHTEPVAEIDRYLFACDEISGFMNAVALMRPNGFADMKVKSVTKKLKDKRFAENVNRDDIDRGCELIHTTLQDHIANLISAFKMLG